jgi:predicted nucleotidyltransferase
MSASLQFLMESRREQREKDARRRAARVLRTLRGKGVRATVIGSLAQGRFRLHSDVDFLVTACPSGLKYTLENQVEDIMDGIPFDVLYQEECRAG